MLLTAVQSEPILMKCCSGWEHAMQWTPLEVQTRNEGETDKFKKFERSHLPSSENLPKNVYGWDGERLGQIRFLVLLFSLHSHTLILFRLHSIPYQHQTLDSQNCFFGYSIPFHMILACLLISEHHVDLFHVIPLHRYTWRHRIV